MAGIDPPIFEPDWDIRVVKQVTRLLDLVDRQEERIVELERRTAELPTEDSVSIGEEGLWHVTHSHRKGESSLVSTADEEK